VTLIHPHPHPLQQQQQQQQQQQPTTIKWIQKLWQRLLLRSSNTIDDEDLWNLELAEYALAACHQNHPWAEWIAQWQRDDPMHRLVCDGVAPHDVTVLEQTAENMHQIVPALDPLALQAALSLRLARYARHASWVRPHQQQQQQLQQQHSKTNALNTTNRHQQQPPPQHHDPELARMYSLVSSRALALDDHGNTGVVPFHDMINHSSRPNLQVVMRHETMEIYCTRDVDAGQELFLQYTQEGVAMDEIKALWTYIQWGIPTPNSEISTTTTTTTKTQAQ